MYNYLGELEEVQFELEKLSSVALVLSDALNAKNSNSEMYGDVADLLCRLLCDNAKKMQFVINAALKEGSVANE